MFQSSHPLFRLGYRPVLDGLRSIAILPVMLTHAGVRQIGGGNFGVDIFFVLSGFLITSKLFEEWRSDGRISLTNFYWRRAVRLLPALFLLLTAWIIYVLCFNPRAGLLFSFYTLFYVANWVRAFHIANSAGLGHTWSLSIEEQFYFIWPPVLMKIFKSGVSRRVVLWLLVLSVIVASLWRAYLWQRGADIARLYNGTDTRADALLAGCALTFALYSGFAKKWSHLLAVPCLVGVVSIIVFDLPKRLQYRDGGATMLAVIIAGLIWSLVSSERKEVVQMILGSAPLVWIGKISYGLYLWHFPFFYFVGSQRSWPPYTVFTVKFAGTFALAALSYYLVEQPIQRWARRRGKARASSSTTNSPKTSDHERFAVVTTCHATGWQQYGRRMVETFEQFWPANVPLYLYAEDFQVDHSRPIARRLPQWLAEFKARHLENPRAHGLIGNSYHTRQDCVRFAHKVAAVTEAALTLEAEVLIWADADIVTHAPVETDWLRSLFPPGPYIGWLDRHEFHPECGFYMLRCSHPAHREIMARWRQLYETDAVFALAETHDSYVLQQLILEAERKGLITTHSLSGEARQHGHPLINGPLGARLDHLKGPRKELGRSRLSDLMAPRSEEYWRENT